MGRRWSAWSGSRWIQRTAGGSTSLLPTSPPVGFGEVMRGLGLGRVVRSKHPRHPEGRLVAGLLGWQEWAVISDATMLRTVPDVPGVPPSAHLGVLGTTGLTAWVGMLSLIHISEPTRLGMISYAVF